MKKLFLAFAVIFSVIINAQTAKEIIDKHSPDRILFGSDMPWSSSVNEVNFIKSLGLNARDEEKILSGNAERLLNL